jgi:hypothetical protein
MAGPDDVTFGPNGGPAQLTSDPYDVLARGDTGPAILPYEGDWPDGLDPAPAGFGQMTEDERIDWLIDHEWAGPITADGYPAGDPNLAYEPPMSADPSPPQDAPNRRGGKGSEDEYYDKQVQQHGLTKTPAGGKGGTDKKKILGMGPRGTGIAGTGITINLLNLSGAFSGWLSPRTNVGSGNEGAIIRSGKTK